MEENGAAPEPVLEVPPPKEIQIFKTTEEIDNRRTEPKIQKHEAFVTEVQAHANTITKLDKIGNDMIQQNHFEKETILMFANK
uniref:Uncharacterized protein n=1 Tax=Panagrolaimus davidi TaxID=227884 RepID=A0A914PSN7_9BILA